MEGIQPVGKRVVCSSYFTVIVLWTGSGYIQRFQSFAFHMSFIYVLHCNLQMLLRVIYMSIRFVFAKRTIYNFCIEERWVKDG